MLVLCCFLFQLVKRRLYRLCRVLLTNNWPKYLKTVVQALNNTPNKAIGFLKPSEIKSPLDDPKIDAVVGVPEDITFQDQIRNQESYESETKNLQIGDHVFMDFPPATLQKSFDSPVCCLYLNMYIYISLFFSLLKNYQVYKISFVDAGKHPVLYTLVDLMDDPIPGHYYEAQLIRSNNPEPGNFFRAEKVVARREKNGVKEYLIKYLHYPAKFNHWVLEKDFLK